MTGHTRALLAEAAGTFMFFFIGAGAIVATNGEDLVAVALAHGLALAVAVSSFGALSGGHFNPAVTFGLAVASKHPWTRVLTYWAAQAIGALVAGFALRYAFEFDPTALARTHIGTPGLGGGVTVLTAIVVEAVLTVAADILVGGGITGASMNPARWLGPAVAANFYDNWFVYIAGPFLGAALAGLSYRYVFAPPEHRAPATPLAPRA